jgi:hypothetical protein
MSIERPKMKLTVDLTSYRPGLVAGTHGFIESFSGSNDCFAKVSFPSLGVTYMDILWKSIEIIDDEYLEHASNEKRKFQESLKTAQDVVLTVGPKGGFKHLSYTHTIEGSIRHNSCGWKSEWDEVKPILEKYGIPIKTIVRTKQDEQKEAEEWNKKYGFRY